MAADIEDWFLVVTEGGTKMAHSLAILTLWILWNQRNAAVFNRAESNVELTLIRIKDEGSVWAGAGCKALKPLFVVPMLGSN